MINKNNQNNLPFFLNLELDSLLNAIKMNYFHLDKFSTYLYLCLGNFKYSILFSLVFT